MNPLLSVSNLTVTADSAAGQATLVNGVSYSLRHKEKLGIVGESGSGKSLHLLSMLGLLPGSSLRVTAGEVLFKGTDLLALKEKELRKIRGRDIGFVFQDPMTSLNPTLTIGRQIAESLSAHRDLSMRQAMSLATDVLGSVGISDPKRRAKQYPFELSGGLRQRAMIAIAIACEPALLIADEPTTALDVTVQAQILDLMTDLCDRLGMAIIWVTHDMGVVAQFAETMQVMYAGRILERGPVPALFADPRNAYTWSLLRAIPDETRKPGSRLRSIEGSPPNLFVEKEGDPFSKRNPFATPRCFRDMPPLAQADGAEAGHLVAAWYDLRTALAGKHSFIGEAG
ncbi:dipeptide transporter; ATP-binding component of ABC superfamily [Paraburkholderia piptadeniae]|uniref:Dipeptide transporter ATP-binding component of ABC superfamily n=1 Tax=Paraburkholderia piptadeniae TaxID=1701573 RepID=A0A1N7SPW3_9BURK|nr:ABC transporter ATP-binding protein [Paraburkholderia piptadeniae]SIT49376.1 dipeptide transporter; ATP-binding component of ABC superfamily [Paraburkholderia piptadeniae]